MTRFRQCEANGLDKHPSVERLYVDKDEMYLCYVAWCEENGHAPISASRFKVRILATKRFAYDSKTEAEVPMPVLESRDFQTTVKDEFGAKRNVKQRVYRYCLLNEHGRELAKRARSSRGGPGAGRF